MDTHQSIHKFINPSTQLQCNSYVEQWQGVVWLFCQIHFTIMKLSSCRCKAFINWPIIIIITVEKRISTFITSLIDFYWPVWLLFSCWWIEKNFLEGITEGVCKKENSDTIPWLHYNIYQRLSVNADRPDRDLWAVFKPILCEYICQWVSSPRS